MHGYLNGEFYTGREPQPHPGPDVVQGINEGQANWAGRKDLLVTVILVIDRKTVHISSVSF